MNLGSCTVNPGLSETSLTASSTIWALPKGWLHPTKVMCTIHALVTGRDKLLLKELSSLGADQKVVLVLLKCLDHPNAEDLVVMVRFLPCTYFPKSHL